MPAEKRKRQKPFQPGDLVVVDTPEVVVRVGYPKCVDDYERKIDNEGMDDAIKTLFARAGVQYPEDQRVKQIRRILARQMAVQDRFGGYERTLHTKTEAWAKGRVFQVQSSRTVKTGEYDPASTTYGEYGGVEDYDPPQLINQKPRRLLFLWPGRLTEDGVWVSDSFSNPIEVEAVNVSAHTPRNERTYPESTPLDGIWV